MTVAIEVADLVRLTAAAARHRAIYDTADDTLATAADALMDAGVAYDATDLTDVSTPLGGRAQNRGRETDLDTSIVAAIALLNDELP